MDDMDSMDDMDVWDLQDEMADSNIRLTSKDTPLDAQL